MEGSQSIRGKDIGDRIPSDEASKALAATKSRAYQFKTFTVPGGPGWTDQDLKDITPDSPNDGDNLFSAFKRAHYIFLRTDTDITFKLGDNADAIPVRILDGGLFETDRIEFEQILMTAAAGVVIDVYIS